MTERQANLWRFLADYMRRNGGVAPSYQEMLAGAGYGPNSRGCIGPMLDRLADAGVLRRIPRRERAIELLKWPPRPGEGGPPTHLMWAMKTQRDGGEKVIQPLSLAFMPEDARKRMTLDPMTRPELVKVRVTIEEVKA